MDISSFFNKGSGNEKSRKASMELVQKKQAEIFLRSGQFNLYDTAGINRNLEALDTYAASLDVLTVCFHGLGQSQRLVEQIEDFGSGNNDVVADNIGIHGLELKIPERFTRKGVQDSEVEVLNDFIARLALALGKAKRIAIFLNRGDLDTDTQRKMYDALMRAAEANGTEVFNVRNGDNLMPLFKSLGIT